MKRSKAPPGVIAAAVDYATRGWSVLPIGDDKRPAVATWKSRQRDAAKPEDVAGWFDRVSGVTGVGIVLGAVSGGLAVRDFDDAVGYVNWSKAHPEQAASLPTAKTARGMHVYFRCAGVSTHTCGDGELRGEGAYVVAPPSKHPGGTYYEWLVPLPEGDVPLVDPTAAGLDRQWPGAVEVLSGGETERTETTETPEKTERTEDTQDTEDTEDPEAIARGWSDETNNRIHDAVIRTLPPAFGQRNWHVFRWARALKAIPAVACLPARSLRALRPIVKDWHQRGMGRMLTKDFGTTWGDFAHAWPRVKYAEGDDVIGKARERAEAADPPANLKAGAQVNAARAVFVDRATIAKVIDAAPDAEWRLVITLSRFGGLRVPSEALSLRWTDIDWEHNRITVRSSKTEHHEGRSERMVPLFPEIREHLQAVFDAVPEGAVNVISRYREGSNLNPHLRRIIKAAGLTPWPRTWHNLRASRQTELAATFPLATVCAWIGNTKAIAAGHYLQVTDADWTRATAAVESGAKSGAHSGHNPAHNAAQHVSAANRTDSRKHTQPQFDPRFSQTGAPERNAAQLIPIGRPGLEPGTLRM